MLSVTQKICGPAQARDIIGKFAMMVAALTMALGFATPAEAGRIKDLGQWEGVRSNQLTGYGIVVGLAGTGDDSLEYATQGMKGAVSRLGLSLPPGIDPSLKNSAAVIITAELPPFAKPGQRLDITVSALGKAKSLRGGTLLLTPLYGADSEIYAMAQGNLVVGGLGISAADGSKLSVNIPSAGRIDGGATVERSVAGGLDDSPMLVFNLADYDPTNAQSVAEAINARYGYGFAEPIDGRSVAIYAPAGSARRVQLMGQIENIDVTTAEPPARVIVNARTGTVVINGNVRLRPVALTHGKLTVNVSESPMVVQPAPFSRGETTIEQSSQIDVYEDASPVYLMQKTNTLNELVNALNQLGASPGDLVAILQAMKEAGALSGELIII